MLRTAILFFILAIVAMLLGFYGIAGISEDAGKTMLAVFLILSIVTYLFSLFEGRPRKL